RKRETSVEVEADVGPETKPNASTGKKIEKSTDTKSKVDSDDPKPDTQPVADPGEDANESQKPTPISEGIKKLRNTYIAAKRAYRIHPSRLKRIREALSLYEGTRNY